MKDWLGASHSECLERPYILASTSAHEIADHESGSITGWKSCDRPVFNNERASSAIKTAFVPVSAKARGISDVLLNLNPIQLSLFSSVHNTHRPFRVPIDISELRGLSVYEVGLDVCRMVYQSDNDQSSLDIPPTHKHSSEF